ncbi:HNH endonuclease family protein [Spongiactinospora sp. TRM90649]|uniref:HNH endonuclease family protein n=1 Tax=Spongiactinospora sp. TRM90649 TaxID=3031114 RepID=UPI0023FA078B|nr:HNH endonuclease family protein [Spongiactinospora sp. TRM90649]MDF5757082.1 HNH endonuclease family protein [Spongiactinospora sp. TRM90649]
MKQTTTLVLSATATATALTLLTAPLSARAAAAPPPPPPASVVQAQLEALVVEPSGDASGYDRALFPHWITVSGTCDTRETVLRRDGADVVTDAACRATSGRWFSPYDGVTWTRASDIDIDHMVPLSEAWKSGASRWSVERRRAFANDLDSSQLWAVTDNVNQGKGDKDPAVWRPPLESFQCTYARSWIEVKYRWALSVDEAEKAALREMLAFC